VLSKALCVLSLTAAVFAPASAQQTVQQRMTVQFNDVNRRILEMAKDWPADKYNFKLKPEMRSFGEVMVHVASGNVYAAKFGRGEKVRWDELDPKNYANKAAIVALTEKSIADATSTMNSLPPDSFTRTIEPWLDVMEHSAEHYGLLVAYYRANGMIPPESRPKK
jgi:hypothetical protein